MERTALRLATLATLLNGGSGPPWPTMAGPYVYDSLLGAIGMTKAIKRRPALIVRTDEDQEIHDRNSAVRGRQCRLLIEIGVVTSFEAPDGKSIPDWPQTDAQLELQLDIFEWQVFNALRGNSLWTQWYREEAGYGLLQRFTSNPRFAPPDRGSTRLAVRLLEFVYTLPTECLVQPLNQNDPEVPPFLPPSIIRVVNKVLLEGGGDLKASFDGLVSALHTYAEVQRPRYPALQTVWGTYTDQDALETNWPIEQAAVLEQAAMHVGNATVGSPDISIT